MTQITITTLKKMTAATLMSRLPFEVTYNGGVIAVVTAPMASRVTTEAGDLLSTGTDYLVR
jgi:hypothetical protein